MQILRFCEPRDKKRNVQITCIRHNCVLRQYSGSYDSLNSIRNIPYFYHILI